MLKSIEPSSTPCSVDLVEPQDIHIVWPKVAPLLARPIEMTGGRLSPETVFSWLAAGQFQLWLVSDDRPRCAMVTEIRTYPTGLRALHVIILGGEDRERWLGLWSVVSRWAAERGCVKAEQTGRRGWTRVLADWSETKISMEKDIIDV